MPWWAHRAAVEGLLWEQPWMPRVETVEFERPSPPAEVGSDADSLSALGFSVETA